jgi:hypothetical protein
MLQVQAVASQDLNCLEMLLVWFATRRERSFAYSEN